MTATTAPWLWQPQGTLVADEAYRAPRTNPMAIAAMWTAVAGWTILPGLGALVAVVLGLVAMAGCKRRGEAGRALALWSVVLGGVGIVLGLVLTIMIIVAVVQAASSIPVQP